MPHDNTRTLAIRALNAVRQIHTPTYLATRSLVETLTKDSGSIWHDSIDPSQYVLRDKGRYHVSPGFKAIREDGSFQYRDYHIPSPTTLMAEATALSALATSAQFKKPDNVFSYRWSGSPSCPYNFDHYMNGFRAKQNKVTELAKRSPNSVVISLDIKTFYPTIDRETTMRDFMTKLSRSDLPCESKNLAQRLAEHLLSELHGEKGIPTGPEFSHVLGDCALAEFDSKFTSDFGESYLRYVDDLILVVPRNDADAVAASVAEALGSSGYELNLNKLDRIDAREWTEHVPIINPKVQPNTFEALVFQIKIFLSRNPDQLARLNEELCKADFRLPLQRFLHESKSISFRSRISQYAREGWHVVWSAYRSNLTQLIRTAHAVRNKMRSDLEILLNRPLHNEGLRRKWQVQQLRYNVNRAIYILPPNDLRSLSLDLENMTEFLQFRSILKAVFDQDFQAIHQMPGVAANTAGSLLRQMNQRIKCPDDIETQLRPEIVQVLLSLMAYDAIELPQSLHAHPALSLFQPANSMCDNPITPCTFEEEVMLLMSHRSRSEVSSYFDRRFSEDEDMALEALHLNERNSS